MNRCELKKSSRLKETKTRCSRDQRQSYNKTALSLRKGRRDVSRAITCILNVCSNPVYTLSDVSQDTILAAENNNLTGAC